MAYVYIHIRLDNYTPFYIGASNDKRYTRAYCKTSRNSIWKNITAVTDYKVEIIFDNISCEEAAKKEIDLIKLYGRIDKGTGILSNKSEGGETVNNSEEIKIKIRQSLKHSFTDERKIKISIQNKQRIVSDETRKKMSQSSKNIKHSEETKRKISEKMKNKIPWNKGIKNFKNINKTKTN